MDEAVKRAKRMARKKTRNLSLETQVHESKKVKLKKKRKKKKFRIHEILLEDLDDIEDLDF